MIIRDNLLGRHCEYCEETLGYMCGLRGVNQRCDPRGMLSTQHAICLRCNGGCVVRDPLVGPKVETFLGAVKRVLCVPLLTPSVQKTFVPLGSPFAFQSILAAECGRLC